MATPAAAPLRYTAEAFVNLLQSTPSFTLAQNQELHISGVDNEACEGPTRALAPERLDAIHQLFNRILQPLDLRIDDIASEGALRYRIVTPGTFSISSTLPIQLTVRPVDISITLQSLFDRNRPERNLRFFPNQRCVFTDLDSARVLRPGNIGGYFQDYIEEQTPQGFRVTFPSAAFPNRGQITLGTGDNHRGLSVWSNTGLYIRVLYIDPATTPPPSTPPARTLNAPPPLPTTPPPSTPPARFLNAPPPLPTTPPPSTPPARFLNAPPPLPTTPPPSTPPARIRNAPPPLPTTPPPSTPPARFRNAPPPLPTTPPPSTPPARIRNAPPSLPTTPLPSTPPARTLNAPPPSTPPARILNAPPSLPTRTPSSPLARPAEPAISSPPPATVLSTPADVPEIEESSIEALSSSEESCFGMVNRWVCGFFGSIGSCFSSFFNWICCRGYT